MRIMDRCFSAAALFVMSCVQAFAGGDADPAFGTGGITIVDFTPITGAPGNVTNASTSVDAQGRTWGAVAVVGTSGNGIGLTRLTRNGQLDTSFGSGGRVFIPAHFGTVASLVGIRTGLGLAFVAWTEDGIAIGSAWQACLLTESGGFDPGFFGGGCSTAVQPVTAVARDVQISPFNGNLWMVGSMPTPGSGFPEPVIAEFDLNATVVRTASFETPGVFLDPMAGAVDANGTFYFTGAYTGADYNTNVALDFVRDDGGVLTLWPRGAIPFDVDAYGLNLSSKADIGRCIVAPADGSILIGASVQSGYDGIYWASARLIDSLLGPTLDPAYGTSGRTARMIATPGWGAAADERAIHGCFQSHDGELNMVGTYQFTDIYSQQNNQSVATYRLFANGSPDYYFGGQFSAPGVFHSEAYDGAAFDYLRAAAEPQPRSDSGTSISPVPHTGLMIIGGVSRRTDGTAISDLAVMRLFTDTIFFSGFE